MSNEEIPLERSGGVQVRVADVQQEYASVSRTVPPGKESQHRNCLFVFLCDGSVGQIYCVMGPTKFTMFSRSDQEPNVLLASNDYGVQAGGIIDEARMASIVMTETVVQKAEEEGHRRQGTARMESQSTRSGGPPRRRLREGLAGDSGGQPLVSPPHPPTVKMWTNRSQAFLARLNM